MPVFSITNSWITIHRIATITINRIATITINRIAIITIHRIAITTINRIATITIKHRYSIITHRETGKQVLKRICKGKKPYGLKSWPDEDYICPSFNRGPRVQDSPLRAREKKRNYTPRVPTRLSPKVLSPPVAYMYICMYIYIYIYICVYIYIYMFNMLIYSSLCTSPRGILNSLRSSA